LADKSVNRRALCTQLGIQNAEQKLLVGVISRLVTQKGIDILLDALWSKIDCGDCLFALLGSGDALLEERVKALQSTYPDSVGIRLGYDEPLAHQIIAGADLLAVPSLYEPCGLTQMYAMRYATLPLVRATGGLEDTVLGLDEDNFDEATGFKFGDPSAAAVTATLDHALHYFRQAEIWKRLQKNSMSGRFDWQRSAEAYVEIYKR
ncbi:MAG: glycosyltransferase, partial [Pseudomonadota bacterium]